MDILNIFFTPFPYLLYEVSNKNSNFALCGVALGMINLQRIFWICNLGLLLFIYYKNNINIYIEILLYFLFFFTYRLLILKAFYLISFFKND
jgi:hypothetical protein